MAGRASIVGAAVTHVGKVRDHNEDAHYSDADAGVFLVCDGMGGHAAGEVASALAVRTIRSQWLDPEVHRLAETWLEQGSHEARKQLLDALRGGVLAAHDQILAEGARDDAKSGMGTTLVGALVVGNEIVFAHAGDSRAYLVRDGIAMQLTEDHTLLARLLAAGIDVDVSGEGSRFRSMLTNALGIGQECKVATFAVTLADGDRFLLCSDGVSEYVPEAEVGTVLAYQPTPARAAERFVELALERGGGDNATALVIGVVEAGVSAHRAEHRRHDEDAIGRCALWGPKISPQQRLRALRIAIPRDHGAGERIPAHTLGDRVAWIVLEGAVLQGTRELGPGALVYPESLVSDAPAPERDALAVARTDVRALVLRADDFRELCDDDPELGETLLEAISALLAAGTRRPGRVTRTNERADTVLERPSSNSDVIEPPPPVMAPLPISVRSSTRPPGGPARPGAAAPTVVARGGASAQRAPADPDADDEYEVSIVADADANADATSPNIRRAESGPESEPESEPEIETFYELDAEPPPLPDPPSLGDDDDPIAEMTVSVADEGEPVTQTPAETNGATRTANLGEGFGEEEPTRVNVVGDEDATAVSITAAAPEIVEEEEEEVAEDEIVEEAPVAAKPPGSPAKQPVAKPPAAPSSGAPAKPAAPSKPTPPSGVAAKPAAPSKPTPPSGVGATAAKPVAPPATPAAAAAKPASAPAAAAAKPASAPAASAATPAGSAAKPASPPTPPPSGSAAKPASPPSPPAAGSAAKPASPPSPPPAGSAAKPASPPSGSAAKPASPPSPPPAGSAAKPAAAAAGSAAKPASPPSPPPSGSAAKPASPPSPPPASSAAKPASPPTPPPASSAAKPASPPSPPPAGSAAKPAAAPAGSAAKPAATPAGSAAKPAAPPTPPPAPPRRARRVSDGHND